MVSVFIIGGDLQVRNNPDGSYSNGLRYDSAPAQEQILVDDAKKPIVQEIDIEVKEPTSTKVKSKSFADWRSLLPLLNGNGTPYPAEGNREFINWFIQEHFAPRVPELFNASPTFRNLIQRILDDPEHEKKLFIAFENSYNSYAGERVIFENGQYVTKKKVNIGKFNCNDLDDKTNLANFVEYLTHELYHTTQPAYKTASEVWKEGGSADAFAKYGVQRELETMAYGYKCVNELREHWGTGSIQAERFGVYTDETGKKHSVLDIFKEYENGNTSLAQKYCMVRTPGGEVVNGSKLSYYQKDYIAFTNSISGHLSVTNGSIEDYKRLFPDIKNAVNLAKRANESVYLKTLEHAINVAQKVGDYDYAISLGIHLHDVHERKIRDSECSLYTREEQLGTIMTIGDCHLAKKDYAKAGREYSYALSKINTPNESSLRILRRMVSKVYALRDANQSQVLEPPGDIALAPKLSSKVNELIATASKKADDEIYKRLLVSLNLMNGYFARDYFNNLKAAQQYFREAARLDPYDSETKNVLNSTKRQIETPNTFRLSQIFNKEQFPKETSTGGA